MADLREEIARLRALLDKATKGPWAVRPMLGDDGEPYGCIIAKGAGNVTVAQEIDEDTTDASLIAAAVNALPALLDAAERGLDDGLRFVLYAPASSLRALSADGAVYEILPRDANSEHEVECDCDGIGAFTAKPEDVRLREVLDALEGRAVIFDGLGARVGHVLDEMDEWIGRAGEAERTVDAARRRLACVADDMTEHAYQELASALESPPRIAGKTAGFDQPGREYTAGDALGLRRDR